jgi:hypothetical protein
MLNLEDDCQKILMTNKAKGNSRYVYILIIKDHR